MEIRKLTIILLIFLNSGFAVMGQKESVNNKESIFLACSSDILFPGDRLFVNAWLNSDTNADNSSDFIYLELMSAHGKLISQKVLDVNEAMAQACILIPGSIQSGYYLLRAYTHYMLNQDESQFAYYKLICVNPVNQTFDFSYPKGGSSRTRADLQMFPRGGKLIRNRLNKLYLLAGSGEEELFEDSFLGTREGDTICFLKNIDSRVASLEWIPGFDDYYLFFPEKPSVRPVKINGIREEGVGFRFIENFDRLVFFVTFPLNRIDSSVRVSTYSEEDGFRNPYKNLPLDESMEIMKTDLKEGLNCFVLADKKDTSKLYYLNKGITAGELKTRFSSESVLPGQKIELDIFLSDFGDCDLLISGNLRNSEKLLENTESDNFFRFSDYCSPTTCLDVSDPLEKDAWEGIYAHEYRKKLTKNETLFYQKEKYPYCLNGKINDFDPEMDREVFLSIPGDSTMLYVVSHDENGNFQFPGSQLQGEKEIVIQTHKALHGSFISLENKFFTGENPIVHFPAGFDTAQISLINEYYKRWYLNSLQEEEYSVISVPKLSFYDETDYFIELDNFIELPNMEEVFYEIVRNVMLLRKDKNPYLRVISRENNRTIGDNPLFIIDGIPLYDPEYVFALQPTEVRDIGVLARKYFVGTAVFDGVIIINTRSNDFSGLELKNVHIRQVVNFPESKTEYTLWKENFKDVDKPDTDAGFFWNPVHIPAEEESLKFETSAPVIPGNYQITIQGIDRDRNIPVFKKIYFRVVDFSN